MAILGKIGGAIRAAGQSLRTQTQNLATKVQQHFKPSSPSSTSASAEVKPTTPTKAPTAQASQSQNLNGVTSSAALSAINNMITGGWSDTFARVVRQAFPGVFDGSMFQFRQNFERAKATFDTEGFREWFNNLLRGSPTYRLLRPDDKPTGGTHKDGWEYLDEKDRIYEERRREDREIMHGREDTAWQRALDDLSKAGLHPSVLTGGGSAAVGHASQAAPEERSIDPARMGMLLIALIRLIGMS